MKRALWALALVLGCASDAGGPRAITVAVRVVDESGADEAVTCVRLPVLLGSRVREVTDVVNGLQIEVTATRDWVEVRFPGAVGAGMMRATDDQLEGGHADDLELLDARGAAHSAFLSTGCTRVTAPE